MGNKISVIIPMYNRKNTIRRAIDSVLKQNYDNIEIIVVDDASTDSSVDIVKQYDDERVKLIILETNSGANVARNIGIKAASGDIIAFQDSDDEWIENKIRCQLEYMEKEKCDVVFCPYIQINGSFKRKIPSDSQISMFRDIGIYETLKSGNIIGTPTLMLRRSVIERIGYFDESLPRYQDYDYVIRIAKEYDIGMVEMPLVNAYVTENNISGNTEAYKQALDVLIRKYGDYLNVEEQIASSAKAGLLNINGQFDKKIIKKLVDSYSQDQPDRKISLYEKLIDIFANIVDSLKMEKELYTHFKINELEDRKFVIYGAGECGKKAYMKLKSYGLRPERFVVTKIEEEQEIDSVKIVEISTINDRYLPIVVAVSGKYQKDIMQTLSKLGFMNYFIVS